MEYHALWASGGPLMWNISARKVVSDSYWTVIKAERLLNKESLCYWAAEHGKNRKWKCYANVYYAGFTQDSRRNGGSPVNKEEITKANEAASNSGLLSSSWNTLFRHSFFKEWTLK